MTTAGLEKLAADTLCSDKRKAALLWAACEIRALREALRVRHEDLHCRVCGASIYAGGYHHEECFHYPVEMAALNE